MKATDEQTAKLLQAVKDTYVKAEKLFGRSFPQPTVVVKDIGTTAGQAWYRENKLLFSETLYVQNENDFLRDTVVHEIAHLIAGQLFGWAIQPHGLEWKAVMLRLGVNPTRCHCYDTKDVKRKKVIDMTGF